MVNPDLSNLQTGQGQQSGIGGPGSIYSTQPPLDQTVHPTGQPTKDSIERAGALVAALYLPLMNSPVLYTPDPNLAIEIGQLALDKICLNILDSWSKNLQEIAEQQKEDEKRKELNPILRDFHVTAALFLSVATIFIRAIFGTQIAELIQKPGNITNEQALANKFASQISQWALEGVLDGYLLTIVDKLPSAANLTEDKKIILAKQIEAMLLSSALAALYKVQTQWITGAEFVNLLANPGILNNPDATRLADLLLNTLIQLPPNEKTRFARAVNIYMDSNPDLPTLFDLGKTAEIQLSILSSTRT